MLPEESERPVSRVSDRDRDRFVAVLRMHCTEGLITLDEFSERVGAVYSAQTTAELEFTVRDLPMPWQEAPTIFPRSDEARVRRHRPMRWLIAVFGSSVQKGKFRLDDMSNVVAVFGDCVIDLSEALIDDPNPIINAVAVFGDVKVIVPEGIEVQLDGLAVFGSKRCDTDSTGVVPGSPVIQVRACAVFGDVRVRQAGARRRSSARDRFGSR